MSKAKKYHDLKKDLGWSHKFHVGGDLNQILGILSDEYDIPKSIKKKIDAIVIKNSNNNDWSYAIQKTNTKTDANILLKKFDTVFKLRAT